MKALNIAVAGCGPAGLAAALFLRSAGYRPILFDQFQIPEPVGSGVILQPLGLAALDTLGVGDRIRRLGHPIRRIYGRSEPSGRVALDVNYETLGRRGLALAVHRGALFSVLFDAARSWRIPVKTDARLIELEHSASGRPILLDDQGRRYGPFDLVVDATGARSALRPKKAGAPKALAYGAIWANVPWRPSYPFMPDTLEQRYSGASQMVGVMPIGRAKEASMRSAAFFWSLKPAEFPKIRERGLEALRAEVAALWPEASALLMAIKSWDEFVPAQYAHFSLRRPYAPGVAYIGDSAHCASPQLGQGANMALLDAMALGCALREHEGELTVALKEYAAARGRHVRLYQMLSRWLTPAFQSDSDILPWLRDLIAPRIMRREGAQKLLAQMVSGAMVHPLNNRFKPQRPPERPLLTHTPS